ncbi:Murein hydrolase activator NlpD precursor [Candidatus Gullanella endobia]|uniref:Murein hydrolase activator NlpD n=1 Tax=Candidatus Gullanella endobia TaxID=1070130 RepID=A0A143WR98_9ENTR|nr:murein hydrolase activator NlpD [Candidatus Gullanella endobia]CUX96067.1 Murein hydrolase activator NlpD precursor [Candidatus Gullanella endobia]
MENPKSAWRCITVCTIVVICLAGCTKNEFNAPIKSIRRNNNSFSQNSNDSKITNYVSQLGQTYVVMNNSKQSQVNISLKENIIYNRNYKNIHKGSYLRGKYKVKQGDTLFYIAWITGKDYLDLAQKNNIQKPYRLKVGQILQIKNRTTDGIISVFNTDQINTGVLITHIPTSNSYLIKSNTDSNKKNIESSYKSNDKISFTSNSLINIRESIKKQSIVSSEISSSSIGITGWSWPTHGKVINNFSVIKGGNKGVDISGSRGQPILATASGRVVYGGNALQGYGNLIIIKHNDDYLSAYAHNDTMLVQEQQEVSTGQKIATMGSSGTNTTKLHFEIRYKGKSVNPLYYLPQL